jgi:hypothetical protein
MSFESRYAIFKEALEKLPSRDKRDEFRIAMLASLRHDVSDEQWRQAIKFAAELVADEQQKEVRLGPK